MSIPAIFSSLGIQYDHPSPPGMVASVPIDIEEMYSSDFYTSTPSAQVAAWTSVAVKMIRIHPCSTTVPTTATIESTYSANMAPSEQVSSTIITSNVPLPTPLASTLNTRTIANEHADTVQATDPSPSSTLTLVSNSFLPVPTATSFPTDGQSEDSEDDGDGSKRPFPTVAIISLILIGLGLGAWGCKVLYRKWQRRCYRRARRRNKETTRYRRDRTIKWISDQAYFVGYDPEAAWSDEDIVYDDDESALSQRHTIIEWIFVEPCSGTTTNA
ncbi:hypothetical protein PIIN_11394 [Serendipita indica DSM 11827]|uniref:Uncharacterized protein n=1 Tax=Serendipita indica (strain DSM 11827) TaxID=1109443 RepID=G4U1H4_SERID|nr:hypothetical protein PIIN_11394 [Serendipita indica DSM 11827]